jgi:hypothetical protein
VPKSAVEGLGAALVGAEQEHGVRGFVDDEDEEREVEQAEEQRGAGDVERRVDGAAGTQHEGDAGEERGGGAEVDGVV